MLDQLIYASIFSNPLSVGSEYSYYYILCGLLVVRAGRPGSSEVPRNPLTRWDVSSIPANGIFLTKKLKN